MGQLISVAGFDVSRIESLTNECDKKEDRVLGMTYRVRILETATEGVRKIRRSTRLSGEAKPSQQPMPVDGPKMLAIEDQQDTPNTSSNSASSSNSSSSSSHSDRKKRSKKHKKHKKSKKDKKHKKDKKDKKDKKNKKRGQRSAAEAIGSTCAPVS
jgi:hypothetical protein